MRPAILLLLLSAALSAQTLIQQTPTSSCFSTTATSISCVLPGTPANGNGLVLAFGANPTNSFVKSVTQTGVTWQPLTNAISDSNRMAGIWFGLCTTSCGTTVTVTLSIATSGFFGNVSEWQNGDCMSGIGAVASNASGTPAISIITVNPVSLIIAVERASALTGFTSMSGGFTQLNTNSNLGIAGYLVTSAAGVQSTTWSGLSAVAYDAVAYSFNPGPACGSYFQTSRFAGGNLIK